MQRAAILQENRNRYALRRKSEARTHPRNWSGVSSGVLVGGAAAGFGFTTAGAAAAIALPACARTRWSRSPFVFVSERGSPFTTAGFARMIERAAVAAHLKLKAHPHMLCHACGYALANKGHDTRVIQGWLGHRSITSTAVYTALAPNRFKDFWRE